jgi:hypothetical protein
LQVADRLWVDSGRQFLVSGGSCVAMASGLFYERPKRDTLVPGVWPEGNPPEDSV